MATQDGEVITNALAEYFECDPETIGNFVICCERDTEQGGVLSSAWSALPHWHILGFIDELKNQVENQRTKIAMEHVLSGESGDNGG
jgi:hypothetical protein